MVLPFRRKGGKAFPLARGGRGMVTILKLVHQGNLVTIETIGERGVWR